jgi:ABC-type multidrug transport system ATPase subunit
MYKTKYYILTFFLGEYDVKIDLGNSIIEGEWKYAKSEISEFDNLEKGSRVAVVTSELLRIDNKKKRYLKVIRTGTIKKSNGDGQSLQVVWDKKFEQFYIDTNEVYQKPIERIVHLSIVYEIFKNDVKLQPQNIVPFFQREELKKDYWLFPYFIIDKQNWDDFGIRSQYYIMYHPDYMKSIHIGQVKFLATEHDFNEIPQYFLSVDKDTCSLGQSNAYYTSLRDLGEELSKYYLDAINDLAYNKGLLPRFEHNSTFRTSLIRSSEAQKALREGKRIFEDQEIDNAIKFTFSAQVGKAIDKHKINFDFTEIEGLPHRIKVIIGKNGTGKTQYISKLASTLSGYKNEGEFNTKYLPPFSRVIAISYSLFDRFPRPKQTKTFSYYYCGFQGTMGFLTNSQIISRTKKAFGILEKSSRMMKFGLYLSQILSDDIAQEILDEDFVSLNSKTFKLFDEDGHSKYSSGQIIMILMLAEILAYTTEDSLLLFDEPETHLHPNSISLFISVITKILNEHKSYAIISTHSPQIVQEIPSKDIVVIDRIDNIPSIRNLDLESFGENLNIITERVFYTINHDEYYRTFFTRLSKKYSYKEILKLFNDNSLPLSLNAKMFLRSIYTE